VILYRCFAWDERAEGDQPDGPLWFPRVFQGEGRHDNPDVYGCLYLADRALSCVVEQLARFRGQRLTPALLRRRGLPLGLAELELSDAVEFINLDDPSTLRREGLRPSVVATRQRNVTQPQARKLHERHPDAIGLSWWSSYEALWVNLTLFDRAGPLLRLHSVRRLRVDDPAVIEAAHFFELRVG
jgi:RES domain-containing protein